MMKQRGLTLLELIIALVIVGLLLSMALPGYSELRQRDQVHTSTLGLYQAMQFTRNYAVSHNRRVTMKNASNWHDGWEIYADANNNGQRDENEPILQISNGLGDVKVVPNENVNNYVSFIGSGESRQQSNTSKGAIQVGTFYICHPNQPGTTYQLTLSRGGRVNMRKTTENPCQSN